MLRIISLFLGYVAGSFLTACVVTKKVCEKSPFDIGSHNPGMANVMAQCGFKPGIVVLAGDLLKTLIPCLLCRFVFFPGENGIIATLYSGLGAVLGHNFPFWHSFKGGKGVSASCAAMFCIHPFLGIIAMVCGMLVVFSTKYLSIGAAVIPAAFIPAAIHLCGTEGGIVYLLLFHIMLFVHRNDFKRIKTGEEEKVDVLALIKRMRT